MITAPFAVVGGSAITAIAAIAANNQQPLPTWATVTLLASIAIAAVGVAWWIWRNR